MKSVPRVKKESSVSIAPNGEVFPLPKPDDYIKEFKRLQKLVAKNRKEGREIVVVMGLGFVGAVMAGIVADAVQKKDPHGPPPALRATSTSGGQKESCPPLEGVGGGSSSSLVARRSSLSTSSLVARRSSLSSPSPAVGTPTKFVIGVQRPSTRSYWKIPYLNRGIAPVEAEDPEVAPLIARCVNEKKTLTATFTEDALTLADCVVVDVQCDYFKETLGNCRQGHAEIAALEDSLKIIGDKIRPDCLVLIETTVPPGTTEYIAYPIIKKAFERRFGSPDQSTPEDTKLKTLDSRLRGNDKKGGRSSLMSSAAARINKDAMVRQAHHDKQGGHPELAEGEDAVGGTAVSPAGGGAGGGHSSLVARRSSLSTSSLIAVFP